MDELDRLPLLLVTVSFVVVLSLVTPLVVLLLLVLLLLLLALLILLLRRRCQCTHTIHAPHTWNTGHLQT